MDIQTELTSTMARTPASQKHLDSKVRVIVRLRPFLPSEIAARGGNSVPCISALDPDCGSCEEVVVHLKDHESSRKECYKLDSFYGQENDNVTQIFHKEVSPLIHGIFHGFNSTVFAYGATGSGKTYTMQGSEELPGLIPLAMSTVLSMCESTGNSAEISYYEVYMDRCFDLLEPKAKEISLLEDKDGQVQLRGLSRIPVSSVVEFHEIFASGIQRRKVAHTSLNDVSSRSHGVLVIFFSSTSGDGSKALVRGKLNLIDLAGNEDNRKTCNEGIRLQESAKINQSLFALSNVIYALNNNEARVPYRESKLTRILQDSLGGMSSCLMVVCLNPGDYQEAVHTVSLAARSRQISNYFSSDKKQYTPKVKVDMEAKLQAWLESKGKTKSVQRTGLPCSPFSINTLSSMSSLKRNKLYQTPAKRKVTGIQSESAAKERNLCNSGARVAPSMENDYKDHFGTIRDEDSRITKDKSCNDCTNTALSVDAQTNTSIDMGLNTADECLEGSDATTSMFNVLESVILPGESLDKEKITMPSFNTVGSSPDRKPLAKNDNIRTTVLSTKSVGSPPTNDRVRELQNSIRKILSPINPNINTKNLEDLSSKDRVCVVFFEPTTPKTPYPITGTPLDKFNARSSNLKSSLVQEYLAFLNSASREELLELKGIGQKRADYIIQIRETSPFQSLCDLEKMGLSYKQVNDIFRRAARKIFD
ncbi:kinesin-like protein KIN-10B [Macadamia integrifolia]|uniref:kinesin-like protein KIN-10B n=1 Tax=Macadamia integrifolia TaxID=60698 RepID=UPI001C4F73DA|nr:kinesin-like protein KIN-10B [Macadamia integrifolia]